MRPPPATEVPFQQLYLDQTVRRALPDEICLAIAVEIPLSDDIPAQVERIVCDDPATERGVAVQELHFQYAVGGPPPN